MSRPISPYLAIQQFQDIYLRDNFKALNQYFTEQNQLLDFKFFERVFTAAAENVEIAHGLKYVPQDLIVTRISGTGTVTFNHGKFTSTTISLSATGPCRVRFFIGTYWNLDSDVTSDTTDVSQFSASVSSGSSGSSSTSTGSSLPIGTILEFASDVLPDDYLFCNGASLARTKYPELYAVIGTRWGAIDSASFCLPDRRGNVARGWSGMGGTSSTNDPDRAARTALQTGGNTGNNVGSYQADAFQGHYHTFNAPGDSFNASGNVSIFTTPRAPSWTVTGNYAQAAVTDGTNGTPRTSQETRMKNVYSSFIIKYK